jgi:hypothetical protein
MSEVLTVRTIAPDVKVIGVRFGQAEHVRATIGATLKLHHVNHKRLPISLVCGHFRQSVVALFRKLPTLEQVFE